MRVILSGGGTAGHINPAIAIAREIKRRDPESHILFVGAEGGMENRLVPKEGFEIQSIAVKGLKRSLSPDIVKSGFKLIGGIRQAKELVNTFHPDVVVGTGGYVCFPVMFVASQRGVPTLLHEPNVYPGLSAKILARRVTGVAISFEEARRYVKNKNCVLTGNPIRPEILAADYGAARKELRLDARPMVLMFGGSLGADYINSVIIELAESNDKLFALYAATGERGYGGVRARVGETGDHIRILPYIHNMNAAMAAADLVVCRSGAITISELTALGKPSILIPSPNVTNNHQDYNAQALERAGAAVRISESDTPPAQIAHKIKCLIHNGNKRAEMAAAAQKLGKPDAAADICTMLYNIL